MKKCPYCAEEIQDDAIKCRYCREALNKPTKKIVVKYSCPKCHSNYDASWKVCLNCGTPLVRKDTEVDIKSEDVVDHLIAAKDKRYKDRQVSEVVGAVVIVVMIIAAAIFMRDKWRYAQEGVVQMQSGSFVSKISEIMDRYTYPGNFRANDSTSKEEMIKWIRAYREHARSDPKTLHEYQYSQSLNVLGTINDRNIVLSESLGAIVLNKVDQTHWRGYVECNNKHGAFNAYIIVDTSLGGKPFIRDDWRTKQAENLIGIEVVRPENQYGYYNDGSPKKTKYYDENGRLVSKSGDIL